MNKNTKIIFILFGLISAVTGILLYLRDVDHTLAYFATVIGLSLVFFGFRKSRNP